MLFKTAQWLFERLILKKISIEAKIIQDRLEIFDGACVISSPSAWSFFKSHYTINPLNIILEQSLQFKSIKEKANSINEEVMIGVGGGRVLDITKAIAKICKKKCILIPTILSTTAWLNPGASLKDGLKVHHAPGKYDEVLIDPEFIAKAPPHLNIGGIADILCGFNSLSDWILARKLKGKDLPKTAKELVLGSCDRIKEKFESFLPITPRSIEFMANNFIEALSLCWGFHSGRPVEGSEHFLYYALEESHDKPMNHGSIIALNTLVCLRLRGEDALIEASELMKFYKRIGISFELNSIGIPIEIYEKTLKSMKEFVNKRKLPFSLWNLDNLLENYSVKDIL